MTKNENGFQIHENNKTCHSSLNVITYVGQTLPAIDIVALCIFFQFL